MAARVRRRSGSDDVTPRPGAIKLPDGWDLHRDERDQLIVPRVRAVKVGTVRGARRR
jgi:hypothetical protein